MSKINVCYFSKAQAQRAIKRAGMKPSDFEYIKEDGLTFPVKKESSK